MTKSLSNMSSLYTYILKAVRSAWRDLGLPENARSIQAGGATVLRHVQDYIPSDYLAGNPLPEGYPLKDYVIQILNAYKRCLQSARDIWSKVDVEADPDTIQATAATLMITMARSVTLVDQSKPEYVETTAPKYTTRSRA